jgi:hypothetical protein
MPFLFFMPDGSSTVCNGDTNDISVAELKATTVDSGWLKVAITMFRSFVVMAAVEAIPMCPVFAALL